MPATLRVLPERPEAAMICGLHAMLPGIFALGVALHSNKLHDAVNVSRTTVCFWIVMHCLPALAISGANVSSRKGGRQVIVIIRFECHFQPAAGVKSLSAPAYLFRETMEVPSQASVLTSSLYMCFFSRQLFAFV
jgi:hypothetical protein